MTCEVEYFLSGFDIPQLSSMVHRSSCNQHAMRVESQAYDLHLMSLQCVITLACIGVPNFGCSVERASHDFVSIEIYISTILLTHMGC